MVVSTGLAKHVATVLGLPETSVASHVRNLREAGLLTKTGRGITAARMTSRDAAHLLIATSASLNVKDSVRTVSEFGNLVSFYGRSRIALPTFRNLAADHTVLDALSALLDAVGNHEFISPSEYSFYVRFYRPLIKVQLEWKNQKTDDRAVAEYKSSDWPLGWHDLEVRSTFTEMTILQLGGLVAGRIEPE